MAPLLDELKMELKKYKEDAQEGKGSFGFVFQFLEMEIWNYEKQQETSAKQEDWDKEEAIFNEQVILCGEEKGKGGKRMENLRLKKTTKEKKNNSKNKYNTGKQQKRGIQKREIEVERQGGKKGREKKRGKKERKRSYKGPEQDIEKQDLFRDNG